MKIKYSDVLELIILFLLLLLFANFINDKYVCSVKYEIHDFNFSFNISNYSNVYYSKEDTLFIMQENINVNYKRNVSCDFRLKNKH